MDSLMPADLFDFLSDGGKWLTDGGKWLTDGGK